MKFAEIIIEHKASKLDRPFTYGITPSQAEDIRIGVRVAVPFGKNNIPSMGIVVNISETTEIKNKIKNIIQILDTKPIISLKMVNLARWMREEYLCTFYEALSVILPPGDFKEINNIISLSQLDIDLQSLDDEEIKVIEILKTEKQILYIEIRDRFKWSSLNKTLNKLENKGIIDIELDIKKRVSIKYENILYKSKDISTEDGLKIIGKAAKKQRDIWETEWNKYKKTEKELLREFNTSSAVLKGLISKGLIKVAKSIINKEVIEVEIPKYEKIKFNNEQELAYNKIINSAVNNYLLHGITGSGKTEIYLQLVEELLKQKKDSIILVPEISLTPQTIDRFVGRFGNKVAILHSRLTKSQRFSQWRRIQSGEYSIVVGARSAIFAPFKNLGLIIIDEEHENSYKSSINPKYDTIEVARKRVELENAKLILGSATPSIETYYNSYKQKYRYLELKERATKMQLPTIEVVDMRSELLNGNKSIFSNSLKNKMDLALNNKEQIILFLNRRGYAGFVTCRSCGYVSKCENCDISMTLHKSSNRMRCHYCGATKQVPKICPSCGSEYIRTFGIGTEKIEEEVKKEYPNAKISRMDSDTVKKRIEYDIILNKMKDKEIDILIGTQMITKGLDFPNVTLVGIIAADTTLNLPDFKSPERSFQLITQVAGRAGRGDKPGNVVLQTYNPEHYSITSAKDNSYRDFYDIEINLRKEFNYPPFVNIIAILFYGKDQSIVKDSIIKTNIIINKEIKKLNLDKIEVNNPLPAPLERINNEFRWMMLIKYNNIRSSDIKNILKEVLIYDKALIKSQGVKVSITVNPESVL